MGRIIFLLILCSISFVSTMEGRSPQKYTLSICAIFKNEARFLREWIEFHRLVGVDHFYLCNHGSQDEFYEVLDPYIEAGMVDLIEWDVPASNLREWCYVQCAAYKTILKLCAYETEWLAILDTDEFLFPTQGNNLKTILKKFSKASAVGVNWQMFGTSHVERIPEDALLITQLVMRAPVQHGENIHIKSIVRPVDVKGCSNPHFCILKEGCLQASEKGEPFTGPFSPSISVDLLRINHYWTRDEEYFYTTKIPRRMFFQDNYEDCLKRNKIYNSELDTTILRFSEELEQRLGLLQPQLQQYK